MFNNLKHHHIGCLVNSIDNFKNDNYHIWPETCYSEIFAIKMQQVRVCFLLDNGGFLLELIEPGIENIPLRKMLAKGFSYYHMAFLSSSYENSAAQFRTAGCHQVSEFLSEAFGGKRCSFFYHSQLKLIELIEG